ncbi:MAG TPA: DUF2179 domain-containing protein [Thermoanaerobaculia bacterium]|nr:DUF2179 domain-containing protein [Thermoanaerobaculia bacterium]
MGGELWPLVGVPLLILLARMIDVTLGTVRIIFVSRGLRRVAPLVGFVEILVWLLAITQVMQHLDRPLNYVAYAAGFALGTWLGIVIEQRLALGLLSVRIITEDDAEDLMNDLGEHRFGVTTFAARGLRGNVRLLFTIIPRNQLEHVMDIVRHRHPSAFVAVSDVREASEGYLPLRQGLGQRVVGGLRKSK